MGLFSFLRGAGRAHKNAEQEADLAIAIKEAVEEYSRRNRRYGGL